MLAMQKITQLKAAMFISGVLVPNECMKIDYNAVKLCLLICIALHLNSDVIGTRENTMHLS